MRRIFMMLLAFVLLIFCIYYTVSAEGIGTFSLSSDHPLHILIVADPQDIDTPQPAMLSLLNASLDAAKPDLVVFLGDMTPENEEKYGDGSILQERFQHMLEDYKKEYVKDIPKYRKLIKDCMRAWICNKKDKVAEILGILKKCEKDMDAETQLEYWELQASLKEQS